MKTILTKSIIIFCVVGFSFAQTGDIVTSGLVPDFDAKLSFGFNCDYLRSPLKVSFDYPKGYFSINIPLTYSPPKTLTGAMTEPLADQFEEGEDFEPTASAKQNANTTIKVDVPMMGGVMTFSNMQMMYFRYMNTLGLANLKISQPQSDDSEFGLFMRGMVSVPIDVQMGWETMTFGYAYQVNDMLKFAFNLHRHVFTFDVKGKIDIDILGKFSFNIEGEPVEQEIEYPLNNIIDGHYEVERWTPTLAIKYWRVSLISRFGMTTTPRGFLTARYSVPFFIDPETFSVDEALRFNDRISD